MLHTNERSNEQENKTVNKVNQCNKRMFKHLLVKKNETVQKQIMRTCHDIPNTIYNPGDDITETKSDESDNNHLIIKPVYKNRNVTNLWENCYRNDSDKDDQSVTTPAGHNTELTYTGRDRPAVTEKVKGSKKDRERSRERKEMLNNENVENKARKIYEEILEVVQGSSPASLPVSRGVLVGYAQAHQGQDRNIKTGKIGRIDEKNTR